MDTQNAIVSVDLGPRSYDIHVGPGLLDSLGQIIRSISNAAQVTIVTDQNVARHYSMRAVASAEAAGFATKTITIPPGESSKSLAMAQRLYDGLAERRRGRHDPIVALGGGVVGDLAGFVAATWMRGVPFVQCPTTTESMIDAGVGGKTAVNHDSGKNLIGAFHQPIVVVMDTETTQTLDDRDYRAGLAESVKHALITDGDFLEWHEAKVSGILTREPKVLTELVLRNCRIKAAVVQSDEREMSIDQVGRAVLNFGHTAGHAFEALSRGELRHGEAVSLGIVVALAISNVEAGLSSEISQRTASLLTSLQLPIKSEVKYSIPDLLTLMEHDKKNRHPQVRFVLLKGLGQPVWFESDLTPIIEDAIARIMGP